MHTTVDYNIHRCDAAALKKIGATFKRGTITLWNWQISGNTEIPYLSINITVPGDQKVRLHYYCMPKPRLPSHPISSASQSSLEASMYYNQREAFMAEIDEWVKERMQSVEIRSTDLQQVERGWELKHNRTDDDCEECGA